MQCHIQIKNLALAYRWKSFQKSIFEDLNLCIPTGAFVTIFGSNGSGKSSLVKLILGLETPQTGTVLINTEKVKFGYPEALKKSDVSYLSQQIEDLFFSDTVAEELLYDANQSHDPEFSEISQALGLEILMDRHIESLSGGERQALALAQFMTKDAPLLILDEPSSYLDQGKAALLRTFLKKAHQSGKTILHITQFASECKWGSHSIDLDNPIISIAAL